MFAGERSNEKCFSSVLDPVPLLDLNSYLMDANEREILTEIERREEAKEKPCEMCNGYGVIRGHVCHFCLGRRIELTENEYKTLVAVADDNRILNEEFIN